MSHHSLLTRRSFIAGVGCRASRCRPTRHLPFRLCRRLSTKDFRIGYRKAPNTPVLLKLHGTLEKRLVPLGVTIWWTEFPAGPQLLEGLNVGAIGFGYVGEAPAVFAQVAQTSSIPPMRFRHRVPKAFLCIERRRSKRRPIRKTETRA